MWIFSRDALKKKQKRNRWNFYPNWILRKPDTVDSQVRHPAYHLIHLVHDTDTLYLFCRKTFYNKWMFVVQLHIKFCLLFLSSKAQSLDEGLYAAFIANISILLCKLVVM